MYNTKGALKWDNVGVDDGQADRDVVDTGVKEDTTGTFTIIP